MLTMLKPVTHSPQPFWLCFHAFIFLTRERLPFQPIKEIKNNKNMKNKKTGRQEKNVFWSHVSTFTFCLCGSLNVVFLTSLAGSSTLSVNKNYTSMHLINPKSLCNRAGDFIVLKDSRRLSV